MFDPALGADANHCIRLISVPTGLSEEARQAYAAEHPSLPVADVDGNGPADPGTALFFRFVDGLAFSLPD